MESPDWESPSKLPETCDDRIAGCIGALGGTGFEVQEFQEPTGTESRHTRGHLDGSLGIIGSDRSGGSSTDEQFEVCVRRVLAFIESRSCPRMTETKAHKHDKMTDGS